MIKTLKNLMHNPPKSGLDYKTHILTVACKEEFKSFEAAHKLYLKPRATGEENEPDEKTSAGETAPKKAQEEKNDGQVDTLPLTERKELTRALDFEASEAAQKQHEELTLYVVIDFFEEKQPFCDRLAAMLTNRTRCQGQMLALYAANCSRQAQVYERENYYKSSPKLDEQTLAHFFHLLRVLHILPCFV